MSFVLSLRLQCEPLRSLAAASINGVYMGVGTTMAHPIRMFVLQNLTDAAVIFSLDGINDHIPMPSNGYLVLDLCANKTLESGYYYAEGQRMYVKALAANPTTGSVYISTFYGAST